MTVSDKISGQLHRSWRLDMQARTELGRVVASGADQSITRLGPNQPAGVELRQGNLSLEADSRIDGGVEEIPAVSWDADFHQVSGTLELPPGWRLLHASGADDVSETWVHSWTLLQIFLVLIIALGIGRLFGPAWGGLALVTLILSFNEDAAPQYIWLAVLVGEALVRVLPQHWVKTVGQALPAGRMGGAGGDQRQLHGRARSPRHVSGAGAGAAARRRAELERLLQRQRGPVRLQQLDGRQRARTSTPTENEADEQRAQTASAWPRAPPRRRPIASGDDALARRQHAAAAARRQNGAQALVQRARLRQERDGADRPRRAALEWTSVRARLLRPGAAHADAQAVAAAARASIWRWRSCACSCSALLVICLLGFPGSFWPKS